MQTANAAELDETSNTRFLSQPNMTNGDLEPILNAIVVHSAELLNCPMAALCLLTPDGNEMAYATSHNVPPRFLMHTFGKGQGLTGLAWQTKRPQAVDDYTQWPGRTNSGPFRRTLAVPLLADDTVIGIVTVSDDQSAAPFSPNDIRIATLLAQQAALTVQKWQVAAQLAQRNQQLEVLYETARLTSQWLEPHELLFELHRQVGRLISADSIIVGLYHAKTHEIEIVRATEGGQTLSEWQDQRLPLEKTGLAYTVFKERRPIIIDDLQASDYWRQSLHTAQPARSWLGVPLVAHGQSIGFLSVQSFTPHAFADEQSRLLQLISVQVATALESAKRLAAIQQYAHELTRIVDSSRELRSANKLDDVLTTVLKESLSIIEGYVGSVFIIDEPSQTFILKASYPPGIIETGGRQRLDQGVSGHVLRTRTLYTSKNLHEDDLFHILPEESDVLREAKSVLALPLWADESIIGVLHLATQWQRPFSNQQLRLITALAEISGSAIGRAFLLDTLEQRVAARSQELQEKNLALEKANERLTELDQIKSQFISDISHELRTPITSLKLYLDLLARGKPDKRDHYLAIVDQEAERLKRLVTEILKLSRWEMKRIPIQFSELNLNRLIVQEVNVHQLRAAEAGLAFRLALDAELPLIWGEATQLGELIAYLVDNAINYTEAGTITVRTFVEDQWAIMAVTDSGIGIGAEELPRIFDRMYRGKAAGSKITGTGLGLTIAQHIVDLHEGQISAESELGVGTTLRVKLPLAADSTDKKRRLAGQASS